MCYSLYILICGLLSCVLAQGFICSCCYWKWIPGAIWIQLIQLNTVNNWSDSETEPCHMGAVTSSFKGWKPYSCAAGLPQVVCATISPLYLITACEGHKADHEDTEGGRREGGEGGYTGIITLSNCTQTRESLIAPAQNLTRLSHVRSLQTWSHLAGFSRLRCWNWCDCVWNKHLSSSALTQPLFFSHSGPMWTAALRATKAVPKLDLHVNQMDAAWVEYLPGLEIRCK